MRTNDEIIRINKGIMRRKEYLFERACKENEYGKVGDISLF